LVVYR